MSGGLSAVLKSAFQGAISMHKLLNRAKICKSCNYLATFAFDSSSTISPRAIRPTITRSLNGGVNDGGSTSPMVHSIRTYGSKVPKKEPKSKKGGKPKITLSDEEISGVIDIVALREEFSRIVERLKEEFVKHLSLRTSVGSIETLTVKFEGDEYPLNEIAQVIRKNPTLVVINAVLFPQAVKAILEAIHNSGMNLNPQQDGTKIYVPLPQLTREHREVLSKNAKAIFNRTKDELRGVQNMAIKNVRKKKEDHSEDLIFNVQQQIMALEESYVSQAETILQSKLNELLGVK